MIIFWQKEGRNKGARGQNSDEDQGIFNPNLIREGPGAQDSQTGNSPRQPHDHGRGDASLMRGHFLGQNDAGRFTEKEQEAQKGEDKKTQRPFEDEETDK